MGVDNEFALGNGVRGLRGSCRQRSANAGPFTTPRRSSIATPLRRIAWLSLGFCAVAGQATGAANIRALPPPIVGPAIVIDADTLEIAGLRVRISGVDAPERNQACQRLDGQFFPCGQMATDQLRARIGASVVSCTVVGWNPTRNGYRERAVGQCRVGGADLGGWLIAQGLAAPLYTAQYVKQGLEACRAGRGLWSGSWERPRSFRGGREPAEMIGRADGAECPRTIYGGL